MYGTNKPLPPQNWKILIRQNKKKLLVHNLQREISNKIETQMIDNETQPENGTNDQIQMLAHVEKSMKSSPGNNPTKTIDAGPSRVQTMTFFKRRMDAI
jgi:hypothetical protein